MLHSTMVCLSSLFCLLTAFPLQAQKNKSIVVNLIANADLFMKADSLYQNGEYDKAREKFSQYLDFHPDNRHALFVRAHCRQILEDHTGALTDYDRLLLLDSNHVLALGNRALLHYSLQNFQLAARDSRRLVSLEPANPHGHFNWGLAAIGLGDFNLALEKFTQTIALDSSYASAFFNRGAIYAWQNKNKEACVEWRKASALGYTAADQVLQQYCK